MALPAALIAISAIQAGMSIMQQQRQMDAAKKARKQAQRLEIENQSKLVEEGYKRRRAQQGASGTILGGNPVQDPQQSLLTQTDQQKQSILSGG